VEVVTFFSKVGFGVQASFATSADAPPDDETKHPLFPLQSVSLLSLSVQGASSSFRVVTH